jgi:Protein of unknown function (DUF1501)
MSLVSPKMELELSRRTLIKAGAAGLFSLNLPGLLQAEKLKTAIGAKAKSVIFLFQWGGPSHVDMLDMKPNATDKIRGPYKPIQTSCPEIQISERLPELAKHMDKVTLVRTMTHTMTNHNSAGYYALSGHAPPTDDQRLRDSLELYPAYGSVVDHLAPNKNGLPTFVSYPHAIRDGSITPGQHASFLGKRHDPLFFTEDPNSPNFRLPELSLPTGLSYERLQRRREMQKLVDAQSRVMEYSAEARGLEEHYVKAVEMLTSDKVRKAFDLTSESPKLRDKYGRTTYGQGCLLARRLVEAGVKLVTVYFSDTIGGRSSTEGGWDTHGFDNTRMFPIIEKYHLPMTEQTLPTLLGDLEERGLLEDTLVLWMGEFGRTPRINGNQSRDHWPNCYTALLAGGGVKRGYVYGSSDASGMYVADHPVRPEDLAATVYELLGIPADAEIRDRNNRPLSIAGNVIHDLIA